MKKFCSRRAWFSLAWSPESVLRAYGDWYEEYGFEPDAPVGVVTKPSRVRNRGFAPASREELAIEASA